MEARQRAREIWQQGGVTLKTIAEQLGVPLPTVKSWKQRDGWGKDASGRKTRKDASRRLDASRKKKVNKDIAKSVETNTELTDTEKDFCLHFVQCYNATQAAWRTGAYATYDNANSHGYMLLRRPAVQEEIKRLKAIKRAAILADTDDLIEMHMKIAFADMKDYALWGYYSGNNRMGTTPSEQVDGQIVKEVSIGADGTIKIKLEDRQKSLEFLERYFLVNPLDKHKIDYDKQRLEIERARISATDTATDGTGVIMLADVDAQEVSDE